MMIAGTLFFAAVAADVVCGGKLKQWDPVIHRWLHDHSWWPLMLACSAYSGLGELAVIVGIAIVVGAVLVRRRHRRTLVMFVVALLGSAFWNVVLKNIFRVPRPNVYSYYVFKGDAGYSFPSGHTMAVAITAGAVALVWMHHVGMRASRRWFIGLLVAAIAILEAGSLMYIGVHYLTDVLGGLGVSLAWLGVVRLLLPVRANNRTTG
jgi:undecaprenyl-diphosphatase